SRLSGGAAELLAGSGLAVLADAVALDASLRARDDQRRALSEAGPRRRGDPNPPPLSPAHPSCACFAEVAERGPIATFAVALHTGSALELSARAGARGPGLARALPIADHGIAAAARADAPLLAGALYLGATEGLRNLPRPTELRSW